MAKNKQEIIEKDGLKYKIEYVITLKSSPETLNLLKKHKISYMIWQNTIIIEDEEEITKEYPFVPIDEALYQKLKQVSEITGISVKKMVDTEIGDLITNFIGDDPFFFIDCYLDIKKVKDPIALVKKLQPIANIPERLINDFEDIDPKDYIKKIRGKYL